MTIIKIDYNDQTIHADVLAVIETIEVSTPKGLDIYQEIVDIEVLDCWQGDKSINVYANSELLAIIKKEAGDYYAAR